MQAPNLAPFTVPMDAKQQMCLTTVVNIQRATAPWSNKTEALKQMLRKMAPGADTVAVMATAWMEDRVTSL